jgi:serine/threonine protein kinase/tricorn protease-like protein
MSLPAGTTLGSYEILGQIGAGGMGEVYKARDTRLSRLVAIKVLPAERITDVERRQRFIQEARAASALNHPSIITIHDIAVDHGRDFLVMEYVAGKTLRALIPPTGMDLRELLKIAIQLADALGAAHAAGILHRDLKPSNIMVSESGLVKILDFGLAKLTERYVSDDHATRTYEPKTEPGRILGTLDYMAPEQAEGKTLDARADIFSFGTVLYEMTTGRRAFCGDSDAATIAALLTKEPSPLSQAAPAAPAQLEHIIRQCLRKDPGQRPQHIADVKALLEDLREESASGKLRRAAAPKSSRKWRWPAIAVALLALAAAGARWWLMRGPQEAAPRVLPVTMLAGSETQPSFSPDGSQVVFSWDGEKQDNWDLYVKIVGTTNALRLTTDAAADGFPSWSPDGREIAFLKRGPQAHGIYLISPLGGPERKLADFDAALSAAAWSPDGKFLVVAKYRPDQGAAADAGALVLLPLDGGEAHSFLPPAPGRWFLYPAYSPDGRALAFASCGGSTQASYCDIWVVPLNAHFLPEGQPRQLTRVDYFMVGVGWSRDGRSVVYSAGTLAAQGYFLFRIDVAGGEPSRLEIASQGATYPAVAPKADRLVFSRAVYDPDIWRLTAGGKPEAFLVSSAVDANAQFSPDGRRVVFASGRSGEGIAMWLANADGSGVVQLTHGPEDYHGSPRWSPDGRWVAYDARGKNGRWNIKVVDASGGQTRQLTGGAFTSSVPSWSKDGKLIYFTSDRTGRFEVWRMPFPEGAAEQITGDGGFGPALESSDARTVYYLKDAGDGPLYSRPLSGGAEKQVLERVARRGFAVFDDGIYYIYADPDGLAKSEVRFHDFATGRSRSVGAIESGTLNPIAARVGVGFSVSPDRKTFLFTHYGSAGSDLMMIENFR